ncbi:MAG TPA: glutamate racemase [Soehngenia sp.]|nr:glutamate racemase [Soehngenia sp.]HPP31653.1 glutamate racemase [Soehngenia sp.]
MDKRPIGVIDSGIGGLTVIDSIQKILPNEDIIYVGDNINVPYGNRQEEEIYELTMKMLKFLEKKNVKLVAIACNTISAISKEFEGKFSYPIIDIVEPTIEHIIKSGIGKIAIFGTEFTINKKVYEEKLKARSQNIEIFSIKSRELAKLIDQGKFDSSETLECLKDRIEAIKESGDIYNVVLACTHYPIVEDLFYKIDSNLNYINPAIHEAVAVKHYLKDNDMLNTEGKGNISIYTTGDVEIYKKMLKKLNLKRAKKIKSIYL